MPAAAQVEDDLHRVLQLLRSRGDAQQRDPKSRRLARTPAMRAPDATRRHRHAHLPEKPSGSAAGRRAQAKIQGLAAIYGLRTAPSPDAHGRDGAKADPQVEARRRELLEARRRVYHAHFGGQQHETDGRRRPRLETLLDAALEAKQRQRHGLSRVGAAVLTSRHRIYAAGRHESQQDPRYDVCAERAVILQLQERRPVIDDGDDGDSENPTVERIVAMVICSDHRGALVPTPCGGCRELLAEHGEFPIYLLNADLATEETSSHRLFPGAASGSLSSSVASTVSTAASSRSPSSSSPPALSGTTTRPTRAWVGAALPDNVRDWDVEDVQRWLVETVELPEYAPLFRAKAIDGATLWHLADADLQLLLGILHPLHRRRVLLHIDRLKDRVLLDQGLDFEQLHDYLAVLDRDRLEVVATLKMAFDRMDRNGDGRLDATELAAVLRELHCEAPPAVLAQVMREMAAVAGGDSETSPPVITFPAFVRAFTALAQLPAGDVRGPVTALPSVDLAQLRRTFDRADTNRSGTIDRQELVRLLESLGRDKCATRADEWFTAVDVDGNGRLSFGEFVLRYTQLTNVDMSSLQRLFETLHPAGSPTPAFKPWTVIEEGLTKLFPVVPRDDIRSWCQRREWAPESREASKPPETVTLADFVLACLLFGSARDQRLASLQEMQRVLRNDPRCHHSRVVHLQQTGHVRLCPQSRARQAGGGVAQRKSTGPHGDESKSHVDKEHNVDEDALVRATFTRFARQTRRPRRRHDDDEEDDGKARDSSDSEGDDDNDDDTQTINAIEAAQALLELGLVCSREQLLRYLTREGFGARRSIDRRTFGRVFGRLRVFKAAPESSTKRTGSKNRQDLHKSWDLGLVRASDVRPKREEEVWGLLNGERHRNRQDYDAYLRQQATKHRHQQQQQQRRGRNEVDEDVDDETDGRRHRRHRHRSSELQRAEEKHRQRRQRRHRSHSRRRRRGRSSSTSSRTSSGSTTSSDRRTRISSTESEPETATTPPPPSHRGLVIGDRVRCAPHGPGTIVRIYRDYFVADVHHDDGHKARNVELSRLRRLRRDEEEATMASRRQRLPPQLEVGMTVSVAHKGTRTRRRGIIQRCRTDGSFDVILHEHGAQELQQRVPAAAIVVIGKPVVYTEGMRVTIRRRHEYARGEVQLCRTDGTYDVALRGGREVLRRLAWELLAPDPDQEEEEGEDEDEDEKVQDKSKHRSKTTRRREKEEAKGDDDDDDDDTRRYAEDDDWDERPRSRVTAGAFTKGERIEARFQGKAAYYPGRIARVHSDGTFDVAYDDGDEESRVAQGLLRRVPTAATTTKKAQDDNYDDDFE